MAIEKVYIPRTVRQILKGKDKLRYDLAIQRNEVWPDENKSLFIHSIIYGYPFPPCYAEDSGDGFLWMLDGKQRLTSTIGYVENKYPLHEDTPDVNGVKIAGMYFKDLPEEFRDEIMSTNFMIYQLRGMTEEERDEVFRRLNNGVVLTSIELTNALAQGKVMSFINEIIENPFFAEKANISDNAKNRGINKEVLLQIISLLVDGEEAEFSSTALRKLVLTLKEDGIADHYQATIRKTTEYLNNAFPVKETILKKVNIPMLFATAIKAQEQGVEPLKFSGWAKEFLKTRYSSGGAYGKTCGSGSAKKEKVQTRLKLMLEDYNNNINNSPMYEIPVPSNRGRRGRKPKNANNSEVLADKIDFPSLSNQIKQQEQSDFVM